MKKLTRMLAGGAIIFTHLSLQTPEAAAIDQEYGRQALRYARAILEQTTSGKAISKPVPPSSSQGSERTIGVFITLVKNNKVRGCYGSLTPQGDSLAAQIQEYVKGAATLDFRHNPVRASELDQIVIILSFIQGIEPVSSIAEIDPKSEGLMVRNGDRAAVLLPGEARTASWQIEEAKRQAGIRRGEPVELFKIHTATLYER